MPYMLEDPLQNGSPSSVSAFATYMVEITMPTKVAPNTLSSGTRVGMIGFREVSRLLALDWQLEEEGNQRLTPGWQKYLISRKQTGTLQCLHCAHIIPAF